MLAGIFAALAGYERDLMHERATAARQIRQNRVLRDGGESINGLAAGYRVSRATIYRALAAANLAALPADTGV